MKKLLIIPLLIVGFVLMNLFNYTSKEMTRDYCIEYCGYDEETNSVPCGNCCADCMGEW